jgi:hypothetical protein
MNGAFLMGATSTNLGLVGVGFLCPSPTLTPDHGSGTTTVTVAATLSGAYIFYKKSNSGALPTHTGSTAGASTTRIGTGTGTPSGSVSVASGNFLVAITYHPDHSDSPPEEGFYGTETIV